MWNLAWGLWSWLWTSYQHSIFPLLLGLPFHHKDSKRDILLPLSWIRKAVWRHCELEFVNDCHCQELCLIILCPFMKCNLSSHCASQKTPESLLEKEGGSEASAFVCVHLQSESSISWNSKAPGSENVVARVFSGNKTPNLNYRF